MGRLLIGYAVGTITAAAPVFGAEIAKVSISTRCETDTRKYEQYKRGTERTLVPVTNLLKTSNYRQRRGLGLLLPIK